MRILDGWKCNAERHRRRRQSQPRLKGPGAPVITCQTYRLSTDYRAGSNANFAVLATASGVLFYSWFLNGSNVLSGSNKKIFTRTNVQPADMGELLCDRKQCFRNDYECRCETCFSTGLSLWMPWVQRIFQAGADLSFALNEYPEIYIIQIYPID
jgi:hypothetical protein